MPRISLSVPATRGHRTERRPGASRGPFSGSPPGHAPGDPTSAPEFSTRRLPSACWGRGCPGEGAGRAPRCVQVGTRAETSASGVSRPLGGGRGAGAGRARWRIPGTHAARAFLPAAPRDAVAAAVRRPPSSCSRRRADPRWLRAPWSPTASFPPPG